ncbi:winged helix-turn-helix transcriptional regulator [Paenibacillus endoradicis]|uniref:winged helix-turn-helix transcriptional regulator n=1 Tax=Paenibacillus endoradicis TaxID=2972487 RepID=UPI00215995D3|nr:winged helix-turn-helix transcriptional regulator [Paenibacillus endoradicis]MCR8656613.1 winged helix-turn-helix transcriptional regulator [Paenibacillus endoradicis]
MLTRKVYAEVPPKVEYELSDLGNTLRQIIDVMQVWGHNYQKIVNEEIEETQNTLS